MRLGRTSIAGLAPAILGRLHWTGIPGLKAIRLVAGRAMVRAVGLGRVIQGAWYRGDAVECPCCGGRFARFLPYGKPVRPNARCPGCGALERHRGVCTFIRDRTDLMQRPRRVLHVAPEEVIQNLLRSSSQRGYVSIDLSSPLAMYLMDVTDLKFDADAFDVVICSHVLEHVIDDRRAMQELLRVLRPGGWAVLNTPYDATRKVTDEDATVLDERERSVRFGQRDHVRTYGLDLFERLRSVGWVVRRISVAEQLDPAMAARSGVTEELIIGSKLSG
jgi:SAM-dependent methyltransferase